MKKMLGQLMLMLVLAHLVRGGRETCFGSTCAWVPEGCENVELEEAVAGCGRDGRLCTVEELGLIGELIVGDGQCKKLNMKNLWSADVCVRKKREGVVAYRANKSRRTCVLPRKKRPARNHFVCCRKENGDPSVPVPEPTEAPTVETECEKIDRIDKCQSTVGCQYYFVKGRNNKFLGCHSASTFCGFEKEVDCQSFCFNNRCKWLPEKQTCILRSSAANPPPVLVNDDCTAALFDENACRNLGPTCKWYGAEYGCHSASMFCDFNRGDLKQIETQCKMHSENCMFSCGVCSNLPKAEFASSSLKEEKKGPTPHIVISMADDMGWNDIGYHNSKIHTPTMDELANTGVILENHYAYRFCSPSRSMLMTGMMPWRHGQQTEINLNPYDVLRCSLQDSIATLPQVLHSAGYKTHMIGKWHLGHFKEKYIPTNRGFDSFLGYFGGVQNMDIKDGEDTREMFRTTRCSCSRDGLQSCKWFQLRNCADGQTVFNMTNTQSDLHVVKKGSYDYADMLFADEAARIIAQHDAKEPLFLYTAWDSPHDPHECPKRFQDPNRKEIGDSSCAHRTRLKLAGMMTALDKAHEIVIEALKKNHNMYANTLFIFLSDNGGYNEGNGRTSCPSSYQRQIASSNYPLRGSKFTFWEGGIRTPSFISGGFLPKSAQGRKFQGLFSTVDWFQTILSAASVKWIVGKENQALDSISQWDAILTNDKEKRNEIPVQLWGAVNRFVLIKNVEGSKIKYISGYPGYIAGMDWFRPDTKARRKSAWDDLHLPIETDLAEIPSELQKVPAYTCTPSSPCLFNLTNDESELNNIANANPSLLRLMQTSLANLQSLELPFERSEICEIKGKKLLLDSAAIDRVRQCDSFAPWVDLYDPSKCPTT